MIRSVRWGTLLCVLVLSVARPAAARPNPHLARGKKLLDNAEDERALKAFRHALRWRRNKRRHRALIHVYIGITHLNLADEDSARKHFRRGLKLNPEVKLPDDVSPKIKEIMKEIRREQQPKPPPRVPKPAPPPPTLVPPDSMLTSVHRRSASPWTYWPAWAVLGLGAAAGGTGVALGFMARNQADEANDLGLPNSDARQKHDSAKTMALTANILFAAAGAAAITSGILFYVGSRRTVTTRAEVVPLRGGALVQVRGLSW